MAYRRRIGRRRVIDPSIILLSARNLLAEIENLPSFLELRDIQGYIIRLEAVKLNLGRLHSGAIERPILNRIIRGLDEIKLYLEERKDQFTLIRRGHNAPRVYTGT